MTRRDITRAVARIVVGWAASGGWRPFTHLVIPADPGPAAGGAGRDPGHRRQAGAGQGSETL